MTTNAPLTQLDSLALLEQLTSGALVVDPRGQIIYGNPAFCKLANRNPDTLKELPLPDLLKLPPKSDCVLCMGAKHSLGTDLITFHGGFLQIAPSQEDTPEE